MLVFEKHSCQSPQRIGIREELCVCVFFLREKLKGVRRLILYQIWIVPWRKNMVMKQKKNYNCRNFIVVVCPRNGKAGLWFGAEKENLSNAFVEWCHSLQNCGLFVCLFLWGWEWLEYVMDEFPAIAVSFGVLLNETTDGSEDSQQHVSMMCIPHHHKKIIF